MFTQQFWEAITQTVGEAYRLSISEVEALRSNPTAKLVAAIPVLARCRDSDRVAVHHLATYVLVEKAASLFKHRTGDDQELFRRLDAFSHFADGDRGVIRRGMNLLALSMLVGYENSSQTDRARGAYNPVASGAWDTAAEKTRLVRQIRRTTLPEMDEIFDLEVALQGSWA